MTLDDKIADSIRILREALETHLDGRELTAQVILFSGGNDSTTLAHLCRFVLPEELRATHAGHANTTIGVERTRQFVRDTCAAWDLPLLERTPDKTFHEVVCESGHFGPGQHFKAYQRLKERPLRKIRRELVKNGRRERVLFIAGRRRSESARRAEIVEHERVDSVIWASPLANWTKDDLNLYREIHAVPRNPIADQLGMSGECLCGAFAEPGEFERIAEVDPDAAQAIVDAEDAIKSTISHERADKLASAREFIKWAAEARAKGEPPAVAAALLTRAAELRREVAKGDPREKRCKWGWGAYRSDPSVQPSKVGPLCSSCDARFDAPLVERLPDDEALDAILARVVAKREARKAQHLATHLGEVSA